MAWSDSLLPASFRGVPFECVSTDDSAQRATAEHAYPYVDGADMEDLGRGARRIAINALFRGSDYETALNAFLQALDTAGAGELIHPVFGALNVQVLDLRVHHDAEHVDQATVWVDFAESEIGWRFFDQTSPSQKAAAVASHGDTARSAAADALGNIIDQVRNASPLAALNNLRTAMLGPVLAGMSALQGTVFSGLDVISFPRAWCGDISTAIDGILNIRDFVSGTLTADWNATRDLLATFDVFSGATSGTSGSSAPAPIRPGVTPTEAQAVAGVQAHMAVATAIGVADAASYVMAAEAETPTLSPPEIEATANAARTRLEAAILAVRAIYPLETARTIAEPLKDQALAVQTAAQAIIEARPPLIQRSVNAPGNLRLIAHRWYGDHTRAPELARLNNLRLPNFLALGDTLNAYAR